LAQTTIVYADGSTIKAGDFVQLKSSVFGPLKEGKPLGKTKIAGPASINQDGSLTIQLQVVGAESETKKSAERKTKITNAEANGISLGDRLTFTSLPDGGVRVERVNADGKKRGETVVLKKGKNPFTKTEAPVVDEQDSDTSDKLTPDQEGALASLQDFESSPKYQRYMSLLNRTKTGSESEEEKAERQAFENDLTREERIFLSASFQILEGPKQIAITLSRNYPGLLIDDTKISKMWTKRVLQSIVRRLQNPEQSANFKVSDAQSLLIKDYIKWASTDPLSKTAAPTRQTDEGGETEALGGIGVGAFARSPMSETGVPSTVGGIDVGASIGGRGDAFTLNSILSDKLIEYTVVAEENNFGRPVDKVRFRQVFDKSISEIDRTVIGLALGREILDPDIRQQLFNEGFEKAWEVYSKTGTDGLGYIADQYESNSEEPFEFLSRNVGPATGLTVAAVEDRLLSRFGIQSGGLVRVVNDPNANFDGRIFISKADGRIIRIEINSAKVSSAADIDTVLLHEESEAANANGELAAEISQVTPDEAAEIAAEVARLEYDPAAVSREEDARKVELLAKAWRGRNWFQRITGRVLAWANSKGVRLTRLAAEYIAAKAVAKVHARVSRPSTTYTVNGNEVVETLSAMSATQSMQSLDAEYLAAVQAGDIGAAQRLVDEAARLAGYALSGYHASKTAFNRFLSLAEQAESRGEELEYGEYDGGNLGRGFYFTPDIGYARRYGTPRRFYLKSENLLDARTTDVQRALRDVYQELSEEYGSVEQGEAFDELASRSNADAVIADGAGGFSYGAPEILIKASRQAKLADPVTYDDSGNVIPLSQRFNLQSADIRYSKTPFKTRAQVESETRRPGLEQSQVTTIEQSASVQRGLLPAGLGAQLAGLSESAERGMRWLKSLNEISTTSIPLSLINANDPNKGSFSYAVWNQGKNILDVLAKKNAKLEALREQMTSPRLISMLAEAMAAKSAAQVAETAQRALLKDYSKYIRDELRTFSGVDAALEQAKVNATNAALYIKKQNADVSKAIDIISDAVPDSVIAASKAAGNNDAILKYVVDNNVLVGKVLPETIAKLLTPPASGKRSVLESYRGLASSLKTIKDYKANLDLAAADRKAFEDYFALASTSPAAKSKKVSIEDFAKRYYRERSTKEAELERLKALNLEIERIDNEFAATLEQIALLESVVASPEFKDSYATATKNLGYSNPEILGTVDPRGRGERWVIDGQEYFFNPQLDVAADTKAGIDFYKLVSAVQARLQQLASGTVAVDPVELESLKQLSDRLRNYGAQTASPALTAGWLNPFVFGRRFPGVKALVNRMALARMIPGPMGKRLSLLNAIQDSLEKKLSAVKANKFFGALALKVAQYRAIKSHPGMDPMVWQEEVANELLNSRQNDRDPMIKVGEATPFGHIVTKEDLASIELQARFADQVYGVASGDFVGGIIKHFPNLIREGNVFRKPFAAGAATTPRRLRRENHVGSPGFYVQKVLDAVNSIKDEDAQLKAIEAIFDDPTAFSKVLRRYVAETNSDFENTSNYAKIYEQLAIRWRKNPALLPTTTDELVSQIADMSPAAASMSDIESDIKRSLLDEVRKFSIAIDQEKLVSQQEARKYVEESSNGSISGGNDKSQTAIVSVVDGLNQFTKPRGKMVAPGVFYSYTLSTDAEINGLLVAAQIPSLIQIARQMMDVESALKQYIINIGERMKNDPESLKADIKSGKFYIDRSKAETLLSLVQTLRDTFTQRVQGINVHDDSGLLGQAGLAQKILLLTTPMVPITNYLFGVAGGDVVARSMTRGLSFKSYPRAMASALLTAGTKPVLRLVERAIVTNPTLSAIMRKNRRAFGVFAERFIRVSDEYARVAQIAKLGGWEPETVSPFESAKLISEMGTYGNVVRQPGEVDSPSARAIDKMFSNRAVASLREFMMSMQPKADELANTEITRTLQKHLAVMFMAGERMMQVRSKSGNPGWDNWANPDNVITPQEAFENAGWTPEQLIILKDMLVPAGSIEFLMADYHKRVEAARKAGQDIYSVPLIADQNAEADVLMRALAASNLPVDSARADVIKTRGGFGRAIRFLIGFPGWMSNWLGTLEGLSSISTERKDKVIAGGIQLAALVALLLLLMLAGIPANEAKGVAYGIITGRPYSQTTFRDVISDPSAKNMAKLGGVAIAGMVPYWGEIAAGLVGAQKNRADLTDLTKLSPQLGAISTLSRSIKYATATGDYAGAVLSAVRGTLPVVSPALNRIPSIAARDAVSDAVRVASRNAGSLELKTSGGGGGMEPTQFSSLIRRAVAASAAGDNAGAQQLLNKAAEVKAATGVGDPWSAVKASLKSQFPEQKAFGRMLSSDEKIGLRSRMSPEQRAVFDRGDVAIKKLVDGIKPKSERAGGMPAAMRRIRALTRGPKALRMIKTKIKQLRPKKLKLTRAGRSGSRLRAPKPLQMAALGPASRARRRPAGLMSPLGRGSVLGMPAASIGI